MNNFKINEKILSHIDNVELLVKDNVAGRFGGTHKTKSYGSSCEFADYKEYNPGDDIRKIDWSIFSRFEKIYLKLTLDERQMHTRIYIDASASMDDKEHKKSMMALQLASVFAYLSVKSMDKVSIFYIQDDQIYEVISSMIGKEAYMENISKLKEIDFKGECHLSKAIMNSKVGYGDGVSLIISDFLTDQNYENAIDYLRGKRRDVICLQLLSEEEINPSETGKYIYYDSEGAPLYKKNITRDTLKTYHEAFLHVTKRLEKFCHSRNAQYVLVSSDDKIEDLIFLRFTRKEIVR